MPNGSEWITASDAPTRSIGDPAAPAVTLQPGQQFGPFAIVRPLGSGGMGDVYEAEEIDSGRHVALKVLSRSVGTVTDRARFIREGRLAAAISHPHTIYIYGTEEIEGIPVIAMELASGGTLKDLVKTHGALPPVRAVDIILQVAAGLEAAGDAGVLHRDIKPSNCFVDSDGTVKVGDFGLSISTLTTDERSLTLFGTVLGTPAFASPEQLRGDDLDVRSDIYSVGATLYYLLTGRAPFDETNVIRLVTQVAQEMPVSPRAIRPEVPKELAAIVMRCLAKRPSERYASYEDLRAALEPFASGAPSPASPGSRFIAGFVDNVLLSIFAFPLLTSLWDPFVPGQRQGMVQASMATWILDLAYYGIAEGRWGRSVGKQLFGLRVVDAHRMRPGIPRAAARAAVWVIGAGAPMLAYAYAIAPLMAAYQNTGIGGALGISIPLLSLLVYLAMFSTARRRNGYAGLHDLATGTRVIVKRESEVRGRSVPVTAEQSNVEGTTRIGPYLVLDERPAAGVVVGYDDRLRRRVWIRMARADEPAMPADRRTLGRSTRLRWLSGKRSDREAWDAYEAPDGQPLVAMLGRPHSWSRVRLWLLDLVKEIRAGLADDSLPLLGLDRVWITTAGRAKLLDWPSESTAATDGAGRTNLISAQAFLHEVGARALDPRRAPDSRGIHAPLPLAARTFLDRLERAVVATPDELLGDAEALVREPAALARNRRVAQLLFCILPPVLAAVFFWCMVLFLARPQIADASLGDLTDSLQRMQHLRAQPTEARSADEMRAFEIYVAATHRARIESPETWEQRWSILRFNRSLEALARRAVAAHPNPPAADVQSAERLVRPYLEQEKKETERLFSPIGLMVMLLVFAGATFGVFAALGLLTAVIFRGGLGLRLFGTAVVSKRGTEAGRLRTLWRALIAWSPTALCAIGVALGQRWAILVGSGLALLLIGAVYAVRHPDRGLQDVLAGTSLVPR